MMTQEGEQPPQQQGTSQENAAREGSAAFLRAARAGNIERVLELLRAGTDINTCNANGLNALHLASKEGHHEVVRELLRRKANVDAATKKGNTALHIASLAGQSVIVTILVEHGANVNVQSLNGFSPLYMAAQENHEDVVRFLLSHGANQALATEDGFTPLAVALQQGHDRIVAILLENDTRGKVRLPALHIAAKKDDTKAATLLLQNEHNADVTSKSGFTPLHIAAHYGHENIARLLIERGANVNYQARHNITPLHVAAKWNRLNMCQLLLEHNADIKSQTKDLLTPLHCAARSGNDQVVDMLLNYKPPAPISAKTKNGLAPLHMAAQGDHVDSARILLYHRAPVDDITVDYLTPLHVAAHCGHVRVAKLLLDRNADPNARALNGFTPLHIACKKNRIKVVELLLKYHAAIEATTESGLSPLHVAAFMGAINIVIYLLQQGANVDVATVRGETPLHLAARANQTDVVRVLIRNGAKVDAAARELQTPLHIASRLGNTDIVVLLLQAGANPNAATRDQYTPLHISAKEGQEEVAAILLDHQADKTLLTKKGFTPLHLASKYANLQVVKLLLERGTPVDIEGKNQVTPLHVASHYNNDKVAMLLLENGASAKATAKNGYTPLHISAKKNQMEIASILLQYQADPNAKSRAGFSPLHLSAQEGHKEMSSMLIENGSDVGAKANNGLTAMHLCAQEDRVPVAEVLYKNGAEINAKTKAGYTPLHVACHFGQLNMVRFLIEHGADVGEKTQASYTPLHQAAQQGHNNCVRYLLENGASPNAQNAYGQTPLSIAQRLGYVSVVETLKTVTETTVITETTVQPHEEKERYKPQNPEAMNETMFSESEDEGAVAEHEAATAAAHAKDFSDNLTKGLADSTAVHMIHTGEQLLSRSAELEGKRMSTGVDGPDNLEEIIRRAQAQPVSSAAAIHESYLDHSTKDDNIPISHNVAQPSFLISFLVDARGGAMRGCRHSGVRIIVPPRKASQPIRVTCRYLRKDKLAHPPPLSEGEELASRILEMAPAGAKFLGPVILEVPHFASLRDREREIVILRSDDGQHWKEHQLEATEDAVQEVLNESFDAEELAQLDDLHTPRITRILTSDFPMYFAVVTRIRQEVHCVGPEGGVIISSVVPRVQAIFPDGSLTKTIKVSVQAQPVPHEMVTRLHGNRVAVSPIVTVEPRRRKFHKPITLCIPIPQSNNKAMLTQYSGQAGQEPPTLRLLCSITGGSAPAQWEDITGTTQLTFTGDEVSFTTTVSARFWLMDCQTPRDAARMAQEVYNEAIAIPYMAKFVVFARRTFPVEGQLRVFCMTDDKEDKTLEKQEHFKMIAKSRDVEVLKGKHQFLEFAGNLVPVTKSGDQLSLFFLPFQENRLAFMVKTRNKDDAEAATEGRIAFMKEPKIRSDALPPQQPICTLAISLPEYTGDVVYQQQTITQKDATPFGSKYRGVLDKDLPGWIHSNVLKSVGADWPRLARALELPHSDIQYLRHHYPTKELPNVLKIWLHLKKDEANPDNLNAALHRIGREDIVRSVARGDELEFAYAQAPGAMTNGTITPGSLTDLKRDSPKIQPPAGVEIKERHHVEPHYEHRPVVEEVVVAEARQSLSKSRSKSPEPEPVYAQEPVKDYSPVPEEVRAQEPEQEETVSEVRTVVRTERHVHDTEEGPMVEEKIITTTYEDDVAVNESVEDRTVPLNEEEMRKWQELNQIVDQPGSDLKEIVTELPEGVEQETRTERHVEDDGTVVTTVVTTSRFSDSPSPDRSDSGAERPAHEGSVQRPIVFDFFLMDGKDGRHQQWHLFERERAKATDHLFKTTPALLYISRPAEETVGIQARPTHCCSYLLPSFFLPSSYFYSLTLHPILLSMANSPTQVIQGLTNNGEQIIAGIIDSNTSASEISHTEVHHVESVGHFEAEPWEGEHAEPEPEEAERQRRFSLLSAGEEEREQPHDETTPISSSVQFERTRSASLAAALLEEALDPHGAAHVGFHQLQGAAIFEADEGQHYEGETTAGGNVAEFHETLPHEFEEQRTIVPDELDHTLANLISTIDSLKMSGSKDKYLEAVNRLKELEEELRTAGAVTPADPAVSEAVARALATARPGRDIQIRVNQSRHTTTTKTVYETETPAMATLDQDKIRELHQQMLGSLTSKHEPSGEAPGGTTQKKETAEEGFTDEDGSVIVSKKMTRVVTTTRTQLPGDDSSSAAGDDDETRSRSEDEQSVKSVREKIAMFEQQFAGDKPLKQYEYKKPEMYKEEEEEEFDSGPLQETAELVQEAKRVTEDRPERIAEAVMGLGEAAVGVAGIDSEDEQSPEKKARHTTSHETTTTYSLARKRQGKDYEPGDEYEETGEHEEGYPTAMGQRYEIEEELRRAQTTQAAPEAAPRRISAPSAEVPQYDVTAGSDEDVEAETRIIREEEPRYDDSERRLEEIAEGDEYPSPRMRRTSSTEPTFTTYRHEAEPVEVREEIDVRMLPSGDTVISEKDTFVRRESHEESPYRREGDDEEKEGSGQKAIDFMKKAGKIAGAAIAAPVVLAGMGAAKAYDAMKGEASIEEHRRESEEWPTAARRESQASEDREPRITTQREEVASYTLSRKHEGQPDESGIEAETEEELHRQIEPEVTESYTRRESIDEQGHPVTIETSTHTEIRRFSAAEGEGPEELTSKSTTKEFTRTVDKDFDGNTVITETTTRLIQHSPEMDRKEKIEEEKRIDRISPPIEEAEVEEITTVTTTTITQRPSITSFDTEGEGQRAIREEEPYPKESEFSRIEEIEPSGRSAVMIESVTRRRSSEQIDEEPAEEETRFTRKVEQEPDGEIIITETTSVSRTKRLSQGDTDLGDVEPQNVSTIIQGPPEFTEEQETEGEYRTEEIRTSTSIERQPSGDMIVTETKTTTTIIHQPPEVEGVIQDVQDAEKLTPEDLAPHGGATIKRSSEHEDLSHIGLSEPRKETETDIDADLISAEQLSGRAASEGREEEKISPEESPQRRLSEPDEHERSLTSTRESFEVPPSHVEESQLSHIQKMHEELSIPDFEAPKYKDESESDVALPQSTQERRESSESEGEERESRGEKALDFMKKAGKIAGAAIAAPVVLAGMGAAKAYDALRPNEKEEVQVTPQYEQELIEQFERHETEHRKPIDEAYEEHGIVQRQESPAEEPREPSSTEVERRYEERPQIHMDELDYEQTPSHGEQILAKERTGSTESLKGSDTEKPESDETYSRTVEHRPDGSEVITETTVITEPSVGDEGETESRVIKETVITSTRKLSGDEQEDRARSPSFEETKYERREEIEPDGDVIITETTTTTLSHAEDVPSHEIQTHGVPVEPISHVYEKAERRGPSPSEFEIRESYEDRSPVGVERRGSFYEEDQKLVPESPTKQEDVSEEFKEILQSGPRDSDIQSHVYIEQEKASSPVQEKRRDSFYQEEQKLEPESPYTQEDVSEEFRKIISEGPTESEIQHHERKKSPSPIHEKRRDSFYQEEQKLEPESPYTREDISEEFRETLSQGPSESELRHSQREKSPSPVHEKRRDSFYQEEQKLEPESPTGHDSIPEEVKNIIETTAVIEELASREQSGEPELERSSTTEMTSSVSTVIRRSIGSEEAEGRPSAEHDELTHVIESRRYSDEEMERTPARDVVDIGMKYSGDQHRRPSADDVSEEGDEDKPDRGGGRAMEFMKKAGKIAGAAVAAPVALAGIGAMKAYDALKRGDSEEGLSDVKPLEQQNIVCHEPSTDRPIYETERRTDIHHEPGMIESESYDRELGRQEITHEERPEQHHIVERGESPSHIVESTSYEETGIFTRGPQQEEQHQVVDTDVSPAHIVESASYQEEREAGPPSPVPSQKSETSEKSYELEFIRKGAIRQQMVMSSDVRQKVPQQAEPYVSKSERSRLIMHGDEAISEAQHIEYVTEEEPTGHIIESQEYSFPEEAEGELHRKISAPKSPAPSESSDQEGEKLLVGDESDEKEEEEELGGGKKKSGGGALAFMKKAGKIAGAAIAAPVVLAGVGAAKAYEAIKKDDQHKVTSYDYYRSPEHPEEGDYGEKESHRDEEQKTHIVESESYERTFRDESEHRDAEQLIGESPKHFDSAHTQSPSQIESHEYIIGESPFESKMEEDTKREGYVIESEEYELPHSQDVDRPLSPPYHEPRDEVEMRRERAIEELHEKPEKTPADDRYSENYIIDSQPSQPIAESHIVESQSYQSELREGERSPSPERRIPEDIQVSKPIEMPEEGDEQQHFIESLEYRTQPIETIQSESIRDEQLHRSQPTEELHGTSYEDRPRIDDYELDYDKSSERFRDDLPTEMSKELTTEISHYSEEGGLKSPTNTPSEESRSIIGETYGEIGGGDGESRGEKALGFMKKAGQIAGAAIAAPVVLAGVGAVKAYEAIRGEKDEEFEHEVQESPHAPPAEQSERRSSLRDDEHTIAGGDDRKHTEQIEQIEQTPIHAFSETLATDVVQQAKQTAVKGKVFLKQESCQEIAMEPEVDYHSDLQEKLDILANEKNDKLGAVREEEDGDQLEIIKESEKEADDVIDNTANRLVADVLAEVLEQPDGGRVSRGSAGNESHPYYTATEPSTRGDEQYDTCVTSQEDAYESAQGWTSQDSEYTTATSGATSRLSETDEARQETSTPLAVLSPVDSDRQFTVSQDYEGDIPTVRIDKRFDIQDPNTARSTPDVPIQVTIEEEVEDDENLPTSPSGVLLAPQMDPGRPVSPIPPRPPTDEDDESAFTFVARPSEEELIRTPSGGATSEEQAEMHERAMDDMTYSRQLSDVSSAESRADTIIHRKQQDEQSDVVTDVEDLSMAELSETPGSFRQDTQSEKGSDAESGYRMIEPSIIITEDEPTSEQNVQMESEEIKPSQTIEETEEGFVVYRPDIDEEAEKKEHHHHEQHGETPEEELETVEEEPEDGDSLNEHGSGSGGSSAAGQSELSKYKHVSSDNVSLTSLQEFERLEQVLAGRGTGPESMISSSELELLAKLKNGGATTLSNGSNEGSISSLAEFEKLEAEIAAQQAAQREAQAQGEEVMMLSDIREESEAEDMSVQEDDEMEETSDAEARTKPISQRATPTAPSEADSLERNVMTTSDIILLETSTDSLEPSGVMKSEETHKAAPASGAEGIEQKQQKRSPSAESLEGFEVVSKMQESTKDSLENIAQEKDSLLEGASQEMASQDTHAMLSVDTLETYEEGDKDSLSGDMDNMLDRYPTTLTTFETTTVTPDGTVQTISRRVETRVRDPVMSHVTFTGTESEERLQELGEEEAFETVDSEGNVTRTTYRRYSPTGKH